MRVCGGGIISQDFKRLTWNALKSNMWSPRPPHQQPSSLASSAASLPPLPVLFSKFPCISWAAGFAICHFQALRAL